ncbi:TPA: AAA family ATPase [Streptococcus suis]
MQKIYFGAPGTGKSYEIDRILKSVGDDCIFRATFFNDYSYFDFIGQILPKVVPNSSGTGTTITYEFSKGIFTQALEKAYSDLSQDVYLILEEMSRGDSAAIFGDIFQLLDRENQGMNSGYSKYFVNNELISKDIVVLKGSKVKLPPNFHILGTMNTSDQNVNVIDTAFKRRFDFVYVDVSPKYELIDPSVPDTFTNRHYLNSFTFNLGQHSFEWNKFYMTINKFIVERLGLPEDKQLGQYFVQFTSPNSNVNFDIIKNKVLNYLWNDVESIKYTEESLFCNSNDLDAKINSFSKLYNRFDPNTQADEVFSREFLELYQSIII